MHVQKKSRNSLHFIKQTPLPFYFKIWSLEMANSQKNAISWALLFCLSVSLQPNGII